MVFLARAAIYKIDVHDYGLLTVCVDFIFELAGFEVPHFNNGPCKVSLLHSGRHLDGHFCFIHASDLPVFNVDACINN